MLDVAAKPAGLLSHIEAVYRPGDRERAIALFEAFGWKTYDTGTKSPAGATYVSVHPDPNARTMDDVLYLSEMPAEQCALEAALRQSLAADPALQAAQARFLQMVRDRPYGLSHIAVRYPSYESLEQVLEGLEDRLSPALKARITLRIFRPGDSGDIQWDSIQAFVHTDLVVSGISLFGQVFELSAYGQFD